MRECREWQFQIPLRSEEELRLFVEKAFGVLIPDTKVCADHTTPWRAFADAYFARYPVAIWLASRGFGGKSYLLALLSLVEALTLKADVNLLGGSGVQARRVHDYMQGFWARESAPSYLLRGDPLTNESRFVFGNKVQALMASTKSVRGPHPQRLRVDEADEVDIALINAAQGQPMTARGVAVQTVFSSTHQYPDGTMTELLRRARERSWPVYRFCYHETVEPHGWLALSDVNAKRLEVPRSMWDAEYELQEPAPDSRAIAPEFIPAMFRPELGEYEGRIGEYIEIEPPFAGEKKVLPNGQVARDENGREIFLQKKGTYSTGADWARKMDFTVSATLRTDVKPYRLVAFERTQREPWPVMAGKFDERLRRYGGIGVHDATGLGDVVSDMLAAYAEAFLFVGRERTEAISGYIVAVERKEIVSPKIRFMEDEHRFASVDDCYGKGHLPDSMAAMIMAYRGAPWSRPITFS